VTKRTLVLTLALLLALGVAACGSSNKAPGVDLAPSAGVTSVPATTAATTPTTPTTATTPAIKPPPQLAKEPKVTVPTTAAPKNLVTKDLIKGTGKTAAASSTVTVNYVGVLYKNGKQFDASWSHGQPFTTSLAQGQVIQGWVKGIPGMKVGGRRELIIPASLAYGSKGAGSSIPPNSPLIFVVDLLSVS
jgi:peptidylprolyl isomerase